MRIWLLTVGEPLPGDENAPRLLRTGQFAGWLDRHGVDVTFWTNSVDHYRKRQRNTETSETRVSDNYRIVSLHSRLYTRNVSFRRVLSHRDTARSFTAEAARRPAPDIILASYPIEELCRAVIAYAAPRNIPVVIDVRDYWPDIFEEVLPKAAKGLAAPLLWPLNRKVAGTLGAADVLSSFTSSGLEWALRKAGRPRREADFWFPFSYKKDERLPADIEADRRFWNSHAAFGDQFQFQACFFGALSGRYNLEAVVDAAHVLDARDAPVSLILCGEGEAGDQLRERAKGARNIFFPGWVNGSRIRALMERAHIGILPYNNPDFVMSLPNKFVEYLAGGLPVLSCTEGEVRKLLSETGCGLWVPPDAESLAQGLLDLADHPERTEKMSAAARAVFARQFEEDGVFSGVLDHLRRIASLEQSAPDPTWRQQT